MKRLVFGALDILVILAVLAVGASAAPSVDASSEAGPYEGLFRGTAHGDGVSTAPLLLSLTHSGNQVEGIVYLGEGLYVDGGFCGNVSVPATAQYVEGRTAFRNPRQLAVTPTFDVNGFELTVDFESTVSADGDTIEAEAKVDLPWFCGRDPVLTATLDRD